MTKNVVLCLDGTGNEVKAAGSSNVLRVAEALDLRDPSTQVAYYDPGVGTFASPSAWSPPARMLSRASGLLFGSGLRQNLGEAYEYLMNTWEPGDRIYLFGFSRGAYTARALAGLLHTIGILRPGSDNLVPYVVSVYARRRKDSDLSGAEGWRRIDRYSAAFARVSQVGSRSVPIHFMGIWDTVKATSIFGRDIKWPHTRKLPNVAIARHAVSIDEKRRPYREYLLDPPGQGQDWIETWFAGVHSDVGGSFEDDTPLGKITLRWILDSAIQEHLMLDSAVNIRNSIDIDNSKAPIHRMGAWWALLTYRRRTLPPGCRVHASVKMNTAEYPDYKRRIPETVVWDDPNWPAG